MTDEVDWGGVLFCIVFFAFLIGSIILVSWMIYRAGKNGKCPNCGGKIKKTNLFCPWCHRDLRGGGKN